MLSQINNKLNKKSLKMKSLDKNMATLQWRDDSRWVRAFKSIDNDLYIMQAGYHGQLADFDLAMPTIEELEDEMRETANLRYWSYVDWSKE